MTHSNESVWAVSEVQGAFVSSSHKRKSTSSASKVGLISPKGCCFFSFANGSEGGKTGIMWIGGALCHPSGFQFFPLQDGNKVQY